MEKISFLMASLTQEIFQLGQISKITYVMDKKSLLNILHTTNVTKDLCLRVEVAALRQMIDKDEINVSLVDGGRQIAEETCISKQTP